MPAHLFRTPFAVLFSALIACVAAPLCQAADNAATVALHNLQDGDWEWQLHEFPEFATAIGDPRYNDRLSDQSAAAVSRRKLHQQAFRKTLRAIDVSQLQGQDSISAQILLSNAKRDDQLDRLYGDLPFSAADDWMTLSQMEGIHLNLPALMKSAPFDTVADYDHYLARLAALPEHLAQLTARMQAGIRSGWMPPAEPLQRLPEQLATHLESDPQKAILYRPFLKFPTTFSTAQQQRLRDAANLACNRGRRRPVRKVFRVMLRIHPRRTFFNFSSVSHALFHKDSVYSSSGASVKPEAVHFPIFVLISGAPRSP